MTEYLKNKELWIGLLLGLVVSNIFGAMTNGWCGAIEWLAWFKLEPKEQWDFGLKSLGGLGALLVFLWTVKQWYLSKKLDFEMKILESVGKRINEIDRHEKQLAIAGTLVGDLKKIMSLSTDEALKAGNRIVEEKSLTFAELRSMNKKFSGLLIFDTQSKIDMLKAASKDDEKQ